MEERSLHIEVHREDGMFWSQVTEWPGCFATGATLQELMEAIEDNLALYITPDGQDLAHIKLRADGIVLRIGGEQPLDASGRQSLSRAAEDSAKDSQPALGVGVRPFRAPWALTQRRSAQPLALLGARYRSVYDASDDREAKLPPLSYVPASDASCRMGTVFAWSLLRVGPLLRADAVGQRSGARLPGGPSCRGVVNRPVGASLRSPVPARTAVGCPSHCIAA